MADRTLLELARALPGLERLDGLPGVFLVGGAVRDLRRGARPVDVDLAVEGELAPVLARLGEPTARHDRFGTASVERDGRRFDLARTRTEIYPRPGALPEVVFAPLEADLARRDFTINTLALDLVTGDLRAAPSAEEDLGNAELRILHPGSFRDDPTRLLRLARYAGRLGLAIEKETRELAQEAVRANALDTVSRERIAAELRLLAAEPLAAWAVLGELEIDEAIAAGFGLRDPALAERALALLGGEGRPDVVLLSLARADASGEVVPGLPPRIAAVEIAGRTPGEVGERLSSPEQAAIAGARGAEPEAREWLDAGRHVALEIDGGDLLAAGVPAGPELGAALRAVLRAKRDGKLAGRDQELTAALGILGR